MEAREGGGGDERGLVCEKISSLMGIIKRGQRVFIRPRMAEGGWQGDGDRGWEGARGAGGHILKLPRKHRRHSYVG